jgi:hypothetical protein
MVTSHPLSACGRSWTVRGTHLPGPSRDVQGQSALPRTLFRHLRPSPVPFPATSPASSKLTFRHLHPASSKLTLRHLPRLLQGL